MFLHFQDWTPFLSQVNPDLPKGNSLLKVYPTQESPQSPNLFSREEIITFNEEDSPFRDDETYDYGERGIFAGTDLEAKLSQLSLPNEQERQARALFRFANRKDTQFTQEAMKLKTHEGKWLIDHPFENIHGLETQEGNPTRSSEIHLDIFLPQSLEKAAALLGVETFDECRQLVTMAEAFNIKRRKMVEGRLIRPKKGPES
jgi:hypothetical protein